MKLLTKAICAAMPPLYSSEEIEDPMTVCKFFFPIGAYTAYATEASAVYEDGSYHSLATADLKLAENVIFFGLVYNHEAEMGYFNLCEMEELEIRGCKMERDIYYQPEPLSVAKERHGYAS